MVALELLPDRTTHGSWASIRFYWPGRNYRFAGDVIRGLVKTAVGFDVLRFLSHCTPIWRKPGCRLHGALHRAEGEVALESPWPARTERKLDHRHQNPSTGNRTVFQNIRNCGSHRTCGRSHQRSTSPSGLHAEHQ